MSRTGGYPRESFLTLRNPSVTLCFAGSLVADSVTAPQQQPASSCDSFAHLPVSAYAKFAARGDALPQTDGDPCKAGSSCVRPRSQTVAQTRPYSVSSSSLQQPVAEVLATLPSRGPELSHSASLSPKEALQVSAKANNPKKSRAQARKGTLYLHKGQKWQSIKKQFESAPKEKTQTAIVHALMTLGRLCVTDKIQHAQLVEDGLVLRLLDRFMELGLENASALNITGMCMGLSCVNCKLSDATWSGLWPRIAELAGQFHLEDIRRVLALITKQSLPVPEGFMDTLYGVMRRRLPEANHIVMTRLCWIVNILPVKPDQSLQLQMADQAVKLAPGMDARGVAAVLTGFAGMGMLDPPARLLDTFTQRLEACLDEYTARNLDHLLWTLRVLTDGGNERSRCQGTVDKIREALHKLDPMETAAARASGKIPKGSLFMRKDDSWRTVRHLFDTSWHLANQRSIAYGLIVLGRGCEARPQDRTALLRDGLVDRLLDKFVDLGVENASAANIAGVCKGLATMRRAPKESVWQALQPRAADVADACTLEDTRRILYLIASQNVRVPAAFVRTFHQSMSSNLDEGNHLIITAMVWSLGRLHPKPDHQLQLLLADEAGKHMQQMDSRGLGMLMSGFSHMDLRRPPRAFLEACCRQIEKILHKFTANTLGNCTWSLNVMTDDGVDGWHYASTIEQMVARAAQPEMLQTFSPQLLAMMCEGLARMEHRPSARVVQRLVRQFEQMLRGRPEHVRLMDCTTMLRAGLLWGILPDEIGSDRTELLLQAVEARWEDGLGSTWYISNKVAPVLRRLAAYEGSSPGVQARSKQLLRMCCAVLEARAMAVDEQEQLQKLGGMQWQMQ